MTFISVKDHGAIGNGTTDDTMALQSAINEASLVNRAPGEVYGKGGIVVIPAGTYLISDTLYIKTGVRLIGEGRGGHTQNSNGDVIMSTTLIWSSTAATNKPMIWIKTDRLPDSGYEYGFLFGADILDLHLNGNDVAYIGVWMSGACGCHFRGKVRQVTFAGIFMDKNSTFPSTDMTNFNKGQSIENFIEELEFTYGSGSVVAGAHAIFIAFGTQTKLGKIYGLTRNGYLIYMQSHDNGQFEVVHSALDGPDTALGGAIFCEAKAQVNLFVYVSGRIRIKSGATGNRILHYNTEDGGIEVSPSGSTARPNYHATLVDANNFHAHETHKFRMYDEVQFNANEFRDFANAPSASTDNGIPILQYTSGSGLLYRAGRVPRCQIYNGWIVAVAIYGYTQSTASGNVNWSLWIGTSPQNTNITGGFNNVMGTTSIGSDHLILKKTTITLSTPITFVRDGMLWMELQRGSDSYSGAYAVFGCTLILNGTGPENRGNYYVPDI